MGLEAGGGRGLGGLEAREAPGKPGFGDVECVFEFEHVLQV